jgi:hypothetical protein
VAERHCARSRPRPAGGNAWVQPKIIAPKRQNMSGSLGRPNLREKAATIAGKLKCIGRWRSAKNRTSRPLRGLAPIDVQTALPRSRRHSSRNICRATSCNIIGDVRGVMSPGRAVSIPCWRRRAGRGPMSGSQRRCPTIQYRRLFRSVTSSPSIGGQLTVVVGLIMRRFTRMPFQRRLRTTPAPSHSHAMYYNFVRIHQTLKSDAGNGRWRD